jgi:uncharacterized protein YndB with AHSA1/START domain
VRDRAEEVVEEVVMAFTKEIELNATRAQVWNMISTGPGFTAWYAPSELDSRLGGTARTNYGGGTISEGRVQVYEPGERIVFGSERISRDVGREPEPADARLEFWITSTDDEAPVPRGGEILELIGSVVDALRGIQPADRRQARPGTPRTVLHLRQDGVPEGTQDVYEVGWDVAFHTLSEYFTYFAGMPAVSTCAVALPNIEREVMFERMVQGLGLAPSVSVGERVTARPEGRDEIISGVVDLRITGAPLEVVGIRTDTGFIRMTADDTCGGILAQFDYVSNTVRLFDRREREALVDRSDRQAEDWQDWITRQVA